jgi:hypothetical protein
MNKSTLLIIILGLMFWHISVISALRRLRQEGYEFKASLGCIVETLSQKKKFAPGQQVLN